MAGILFAGGCHVEGWPIGPKHSFVNVALGLTHTEEPLEPHILSYVNFKTAGDRIVQACRQTGAEYLVLQLGHYETAPVFSKILSRFSHRSSHPKHEIDRCCGDGNPDEEYRPTLRIRLFYCRRMLVAAALVAVGARRKTFDPEHLFEGLDSVLTELDALHLKKVFVMSPFSAPDPIIRLCRWKAAQVFARAARRHGCVYMDTFHLLNAGGSRAIWSRYRDRFHLNRLGHEKVGRFLADGLREAIVEGGQANAAVSIKSSAAAPVLGLAVRAAH